MVEIREVTSTKDRRAFAKFIFTLYKDNKFWAPPFYNDEINILKPEKNAAAAFCDTKWYLAYKDSKVVGRIGAIINHKNNETWNENKIRFTRFDFIDDLEVSKALLEKIVQFGKSKNVDKIVGPLGYSNIDQEGMLMEGFDQLSTFITLYNYPYYVKHLKHHGYLKEIDWLEYRITVPKEIDKRMSKIAEIVSKKFNCKLVEYKKKSQLLDRVTEIFEVMNESYNQLYGSAYMDSDQVDEVVKNFLSFVNPEYVKLVEDKDGKIIGFGICLPSLTLAAQKAKGRLFPFGIFHMLKALKHNDTLDLCLVGVTPKYQGKGVNAILIDSVMKSCLKNGITVAESNPELEDNIKVQSQWKTYERIQNKRRRVWYKDI